MLKLTKTLENRMRIQKNKLFSGDKKKIKENRPELDLVHQHLHGHLEITNQEVAIRISDVLDSSTYIKSKDYPELNHIFELPKENYTKIKIPTKEIEDSLSIDKIQNEMDFLKVSVSNNKMKITPQTVNPTVILDDIVINLDKETKKETSFIISPKYLHDAMNFFRMLKIKNVKLIVEDKNKPIRILHENAQYVIAQIRLNNQK